MSKLQRFNDATLEYVIAYMRGTALLMGFAVVPCLMGFVWSTDVRWMVTALLCVTFGVVFAYFGFWHWGNSTWRRRDGD